MTAVAAAEAVAAPATGVRPAWYRRPVVMCLVLLVLYGVVAMAKDPRASMVSDSGGKLATLRAMDARGDLSPDLGYWAERLDPEGLAHPMALTSHVGDKWINVTTLPMLYAAWPLYEAGGLRLILLVPMLAAVAVALGARALARRLGDDGTRAFWLIGLATPVAVYAVDFWEHAPGLACMIWAIVVLLDVVEQRRGVGAALAGGALFGLAATMRTEALVYAAVVFLAFGVAAWRRSRRPPIGPAIGAFVGLVVVVMANQMLERAAFGTGVRGVRTAGAAGGVGRDLGARAHDMLVTTFGLDRFGFAEDHIAGAVIALAVVVATVLFLRGRPERRRIAFVLLALASWGYLMWVSNGVGFLPGAFTASPLAAVGVAALWWRPGFRLLGGVALAAMPLVWLSQFTGGTEPIWGARYLLCSSTVLAVLATVALPRLPRPAAIWIMALAAAVTVSGLVWTVQRTHTVARAWDTLDRVHGPVVMVGEIQLMREGGAFYDQDQPWLAAADRRALRTAIDVADRSGADQVTFLSIDDAVRGSTVGPFHRAGTRTVEILPDVDLTVATYVR